MDSRAALLWCALLLVGCQNTPQQLSIYAPFGPAVVPQPTLSRANSTPYYTPPAIPAGTGNTPTTAGNPAENKLSYLDPYRGIMVPGGFTPSPVATGAGSGLAAGDDKPLPNSSARSRPSTEEPIRVVDGDSAPRGLTSALSSAVTQATSARTSAVKFQASPPSGVVRTGSALLPPPPATQVQVAALPKPPAAASGSSSTPFVIPAHRSPSTTTPGLLPTPGAAPNNGQPVQPGIIPSKPAESRRLSLWDDPGDGSRVMPAGHVEYANPVSGAAGNWRPRN